MLEAQFWGPNMTTAIAGLGQYKINSNLSLIWELSNLMLNSWSTSSHIICITQNQLQVNQPKSNTKVKLS